MHFYNLEGEIVHSIYYPQKRDITYNIREGGTPTSTYHLWPTYSGDALFEDIFNDTIYHIRGTDDIKPYIITHRGTLAPVIKDASNPTTRVQKVYLGKLLDTKKYIFIRYGYREEIYNAIWNKKTQEFIANTKGDKSDKYQLIAITNEQSQNFIKYRTPTGKEILVAVSGYMDGKLYGAIDAEQAMEFLPGIDEFDNPVLMIIDIG